MHLGDVNNTGIQWARAEPGALLSEVGQVAASFGYVAIYNYLIRPGLPVAAYQQRARAARPLVSIVAGFPIFCLVSRWIARSWRTHIIVASRVCLMPGTSVILRRFLKVWCLVWLLNMSPR